MAVPLRPQHFASRQDGTLTALIAVDELPSFISIRGVPRVLSQSDTQGMTSLGILPARGQTYTVDVIHHGNSSLEIAGAVHQDSPSWRNGEPTGRELVKHGAGRKGLSPNNKKEYCSFWLRHGECDYQQQGCIFKHEMPTDLPALERLGLRDIPRWYREKYGLKSLVSSNATSRADRVWRSETQGPAASNPLRYESLPPRYLTPAGIDSEMRSVRQDPSGSSSPSNQTLLHSTQSHAVVHLNDRAQLWRRLDLLTPDDGPKYPDYRAEDRLGLTTKPLQPNTIGAERVINSAAGADSTMSHSKSLHNSIWAIQPPENTNPSVPFGPFDPAPETSTTSLATTEPGNIKRKNHRGRRLYQSRGTTENHENNAVRAAVAEASRKSVGAAHSGTPPPYLPMGSRPPSRQSENVKQNTDHGLDGTKEMKSGNGTASRVATPDTDPFGLKFD